MKFINEYIDEAAEAAVKENYNKFTNILFILLRNAVDIDFIIKALNEIITPKFMQLPHEKAQEYIKNNIPSLLRSAIWKGTEEQEAEFSKSFTEFEKNLFKCYHSIITQALFNIANESEQGNAFGGKIISSTVQEGDKIKTIIEHESPITLPDDVLVISGGCFASIRQFVEGEEY